MAEPAPQGDRGRRLEHSQRAYELQLTGGLFGMARWTVYGIVAVGMAHYYIPAFKRQTWGLKAFFVTSASMIGLTLGAEEYLLKYEAAQRVQDNEMRREARNALARRGIIATEGEIRKWKAEKDRVQRAEREALMAQRAAEAAEAVDMAEREGVEAGHVARLRVAQPKEWEKAADRRPDGVLDELKKLDDRERAEELNKAKEEEEAKDGGRLPELNSEDLGRSDELSASDKESQEAGK